MLNLVYFLFSLIFLLLHYPILVDTLPFMVLIFLLNVLDLSALNAIFLTPCNKDKAVSILYLTFFLPLSSLSKTRTLVLHSVTIFPTFVLVLYIFKYIFLHIFKYIHILKNIHLLLVFQSSLC